MKATVSEGGGGISFSPNHTEDSWEETAKTKSEHADCRGSKSSWRMKRASLQQRAAMPCFCWQVRETTRNLESCNEWFNEQICPFCKRESHLSSKCQIFLSLYFAIVSLIVAIVSLIASCRIRELHGNNGNYFSKSKYKMCKIEIYPKISTKKITILLPIVVAVGLIVVGGCPLVSSCAIHLPLPICGQFNLLLFAPFLRCRSNSHNKCISL